MDIEKTLTEPEPQLPPPKIIHATLPDTPSTTVKQVTVYLTGFGPFRDVRRNPSFELVAKFYSHRPLELRIDGQIRTINIRVHPGPIDVCYPRVREIVPEIWRTGGFDYIIHVGVAPYEQYHIESLARGMGYCGRDADGETLPEEEWIDDALQYKGNTEDLCNWIKAGLLKKKHESEVPVEVVPSRDAGQYLCEYIFFNSLRQAVAKKKNTKTAADVKARKTASKRVLFFHIPPENKPYNLETGKEVLEQLILGMVAEGEGLLGSK